MALTKKEQRILQSIRVPSKNDPDRPEFPPNDPHYPSTPTFQIEVPGFDNVWLKDESMNPTGTHKDRMAWEMVVTYRDLLKAKELGRIDSLPSMSVISSGSAAVAVQHVLSQFHLPSLKVLIDFRLKREIKEQLERMGCELFESDLSTAQLEADDILQLTNNEDGIDITSDETLGPMSNFYDWMGYDVISQNAYYVFVPYGSGFLFENIVHIAKSEVAAAPFHDNRFRGSIAKVRDCHFIGATTQNPNTTADKLYSPHLPFVHLDAQWIKLAKQKAFIGSESGVRYLQEPFLREAMEIAKSNDVTCEPSGIAGLAMLLQMKEDVDTTKKMLVVNTGKVKTDV